MISSAWPTWACEGAADIVRVTIKKPMGAELTDDQQTCNKLIRGIRGIPDSANTLLINQRNRPLPTEIQ
ncbi:hypothetical protein ACTWPT_56935 [Nonomuraea sp. 3N208]|uniref:hypothetical protein n=1 Tax=Nonomuraea sp. 3N208 TaxID=3457421 RepID=UPI003FD48EF7